MKYEIHHAQEIEEAVPTYKPQLPHDQEYYPSQRA